MPRYSAEPISRYTTGILRYHGDKNKMRCLVVVYLLFCYFYRERERLPLRSSGCDRLKDERIAGAHEILQLVCASNCAL